MKKEKDHSLIMILSLITSLIYILWRVFFTIPVDEGLLSLICGIALVVAEIMGVFEAYVHYRNARKINVPDKPDIKDIKDLPDVDVLVATHNESVDLLYKTINGCKHIKYPDKNKVHIYICDDTNRKEMADLAKKMNVGYCGLSNNKHAKAGNLNNALAKTSSPLIAVFDADMIPTSNFLVETVPYFSIQNMIKDKKGNWREMKENEINPDYKIGFIQTPQSFYNSDMFQSNLFAEKSIPNEQDYFFKEINVSRNNTESPIFAGSNTLISRSALEEVGGIKINTITEDFETGIEIQKKGYSCYAIPQPLAHGLSPIDFPSLIKQRQRWGRGCVSALSNMKFMFSKDLKFGAKLNYLACLLYWWTFFRRFIYILAPILFAVFGVIVVKTSLLKLLIIWLPSYIIYNQALKVLSGNIRNQKWSNIVDTILFPYMIIPIFAETLGIKLKKFNVTDKNNARVKNTKFKYAIPSIMLLIATLIGLGFSVYNTIVYKNFANIMILYWLVINGYFLLMSIIFMTGRVNYRNYERYDAKLDVVINTGKKEIKAVTKDISEGGMAFVLDTPEFIPYDEPFTINVKDRDYESTFECNIVSVFSNQSSWIYNVEICNIDEHNKDEYFEIVYDREHTMAKTIKSEFVKDLTRAVKGYTNHVESSRRKLPRIDVNKSFKSNAGSITILDFNYQYINVKQDLADKELVIDLNKNFKIECNRIDGTKNLYEIKDWKKLATDNKTNVIYK